jgi:hypothetical protein
MQIDSPNDDDFRQLLTDAAYDAKLDPAGKDQASRRIAP